MDKYNRPFKKLYSTLLTIVVAMLFVAGISTLQAAFTYPTQNAPSANVAPPVTTSNFFQDKAGGFEAGTIAVGDGISLNGVSRTAAEGWPLTDAMATCHLQVRRVDSNTNRFYTTDSTQIANGQYPKCDDYLTPEARKAGWTHTGGDECTTVISSDCQAGPSIPASCVYTRVVCQNGITVNPPAVATSTFISSPFNVTATQCIDGINNDAPPYNYVSNPSPQPAAYGRSLAFSGSMNYISVSGDAAGDGGNYYTYIYKRAGAGSDTYNQLLTGLGRGFSAEPYTRNAVFANNDQFLIVGSWDAASNYLKIYENVGDNFTKLVPSATQGPSVQPTNWVNDVDVFQEGSNIYLAVTHIGGNRISIYKRTSTNPKLFTLLPSALNSYPSIAGTYGMGVDFSTDGNYIAVTTTASGANPIITVYKRTGSGADTWNKLISPNGPNAQPNNQGEGVAFSNDGVYLAVVHHGTSPDLALTIYKKNGDMFERLSSPYGLDTPPATYPWNSLSYSWVGIVSPSFSPDGNYLAFSDYSASVAQGSIKIYKRDGDSFSKMSNPTYDITAVHSAQFSSDSQYLATSFAFLNGSAQKYIALLKRSASGDYLVDYPADPQCGSTYDNTENSVQACSDGINNDVDAFVDYPSDPGCTTPQDTSE